MLRRRDETRRSARPRSRTSSLASADDREDVARVHATLSAELRARGTPVGAHDLLIAATAVLIDYQVATRDLRSFPRIRGLRVLRW